MFSVQYFFTAWNYSPFSFTWSSFFHFSMHTEINFFLKKKSRSRCTFLRLWNEQIFLRFVSAAAGKYNLSFSFHGICSCNGWSKYSSPCLVFVWHPLPQSWCHRCTNCWITAWRNQRPVSLLLKPPALIFHCSISANLTFIRIMGSACIYITIKSKRLWLYSPSPKPTNPGLLCSLSCSDWTPNFITINVF